MFQLFGYVVVVVVTILLTGFFALAIKKGFERAVVVAILFGQWFGLPFITWALAVLMAVAFDIEAFAYIGGVLGLIFFLLNAVDRLANQLIQGIHQATGVAEDRIKLVLNLLVIAVVIGVIYIASGAAAVEWLKLQLEWFQNFAGQ